MTVGGGRCGSFVILIGSCGSFVILIGSCSAFCGACGFCLFHLASEPFLPAATRFGLFSFSILHLSPEFEFSEFLELPEFPGSPFLSMEFLFL